MNVSLCAGNVGGFWVLNHYETLNAPESGKRLTDVKDRCFLTAFPNLIAQVLHRECLFPF